MKKHVVIAWELGAALGHVMGFRSLVTGFLSKDIRVSIIGRNLASIQEVLSDLDIIYFQSPIFLSERQQRLALTHSYSDIIYDLGYQSEPSLLSMVKGWCNLFKLIKPDLVICDHSPTALLASACLDIKTCTFGNGFFVPPDSQLPILFQDTDDATRQEVNQRYATVIHNINAVFDSYGYPQINVLFDIFRESTHFLCTFSEIDHYERDPNTVYYGPRTTINKGHIVPLDNSEQVVFAYLQARTRLLMPLIQSLAKLPIKSVVYIPKLPAEVRSQISQYKNIKLFAEPVNISKIFEHTALMINNASHGLVGEALICGKPSILLPTQLEQNILAKKVSAQKLSIAVNTESNVNIDAAIQFSLTNPQLATRLAAVKNKYTNYRHDNAIEEIVAKCVRLLN